MIPSDVPERPWQKVGSDLFELNGSPYLLVVDYLSAFVEISKLSSTTSASIVNHMTSMFARHGVPEVVVTDSGPQYASDTFRRFAAARGFLHTTSSPQSNGEAERAVKTLKCLLAKSDNPYDTLLANRSTPLSNGYSPAELLMGRKLRTPIPTIPALLEPQWSHLRGARKSRLEIKNRQQKSFDKRHRAVHLRRLMPGEHVWVTDMDRRGTVLKEVGSQSPRSYIGRSHQGDVRRNRRHLNPSPTAPPYDTATLEDIEIPDDEDGEDGDPGEAAAQPDRPMADVAPRRNPARERKLPSHLSDYDVAV